MNSITAQTVMEATGLKASFDFGVTEMRLLNRHLGADPVVSFAESSKFFKYLKLLNRNSVLFLSKDLELPSDADFKVIHTEDPRWSFYTLHNYLASSGASDCVTEISSSAIIAPGATISPTNVVIGDYSVVESNAMILAGTTIGAGCIIRSGAIVGAEGFEHKRTSQGILSVKHAGEVVLSDNVEIGYHSVVSKGLFSWSPTLIGKDSKIDAQAYVTHGVSLGERVFIAAGAIVCGSSIISDDVWVGPSVTVSNGISIGKNCSIGLGANQFIDLEFGRKVIGTPSIKI